MKAHRFLWLAALLFALVALTAAGCGGGDDGGAADEPGGEGEGRTVKIVSDLPLQGAARTQAEQMVEAIRFVLEQNDFKAGPHTIEYESFDDTTAAKGAWDEAKCAENARTYAADEDIVLVIGTYNSGCAAIEIPILNEAGVAMISPANTYVGLTKGGPGTEGGEPDKYYPTGERNYARVVASDDTQGQVGAKYMKETLGVTKVFILDDKELYGKGVADAFEAAAREIGLEVVGHQGYNRDEPNYRALMTQIRASGADGIYLGAVAENNAGQLIKDKVAVIGDNDAVKLLVSDGVVQTVVFEESGGALEGAFGTAPTAPPEELSPESRQFSEDLSARLGVEGIEVYVVYAATAAQVALDVIARSDGTRADVLEKLFGSSVDTVIGQMSFSETGDPANATQNVFAAKGGDWEFVESVRLG